MMFPGHGKQIGFELDLWCLDFAPILFGDNLNRDGV